MNKEEIKAKGKKIVSFENRPKSGQKKEFFGIYYVPDPNSPLNRFMRFMGKSKKRPAMKTLNPHTR